MTEEKTYELSAVQHATTLADAFTSASGWDLAQRIAKAFAASTLVPQAYQGNIANCIVALEMANRMGASPLMVMQNLYIVHGNPGWSSKFLIASFNQCGRFSAMRFEFNEARTECRAWATELATRERIVGPVVSIAMAKDEGWSSKNGSKWKTMPELMLMYRAAAFLVRTYAPEISMGLSTEDELRDIDSGARAAVPADEIGIAAVRKVIEHKREAVKPAKVSPDVATLIEAIESATNAESAALVIDSARDLLDEADIAQLQQAWTQAWQVPPDA